MCAACQVTLGIIHCSDCFGTPVWCCGCALEVHSALPFHRTQLLNGKCFLKTSLFEQGFVIHLGHDGHPCPAHLATSSPWVDVHLHEPNLTREDEDIGEVVDEILEVPFFTFVPPLQDNVVVIHSGGVCHQCVQWCICANSPAHHLQLFQTDLFAASFSRPKTAFTFDVLDHFFVDTMECRIVAVSFFQKLHHFTNNAFPKTVPVSGCS